MTRTLLTLLIASFSLPAVAAASVTATPVTATNADPLVTVSWGDGSDHTTRVEVALPPEHTCSSLDLDDQGHVVKMAVCRTGGDASAPLLEISVERNRRPPTGKANEGTWAKLRATVQLHRGASQPIGRFQQADHPEEVVAQLR